MKILQLLIVTSCLGTLNGCRQEPLNGSPIQLPPTSLSNGFNTDPIGISQSACLKCGPLEGAYKDPARVATLVWKPRSITIFKTKEMQEPSEPMQISLEANQTIQAAKFAADSPQSFYFIAGSTDESGLYSFIRQTKVQSRITQKSQGTFIKTFQQAAFSETVEQPIAYLEHQIQRGKTTANLVVINPDGKILFSKPCEIEFEKIIWKNSSNIELSGKNRAVEIKL